MAAHAAAGNREKTATGSSAAKHFSVCADEGALVRSSRKKKEKEESEEVFRINKDRKMSYGRMINKKDKWRGVMRGLWIIRTRMRSMAAG